MSFWPHDSHSVSPNTTALQFETLAGEVLMGLNSRVRTNDVIEGNRDVESSRSHASQSCTRKQQHLDRFQIRCRYAKARTDHSAKNSHDRLGYPCSVDGG